MASEPIDTSDRPSMISVRCDGGCGEWIVIDSERPGGHCSTCLVESLGGATVGTYPKPDSWSTAHNPPPAPAVYPPSTAPTATTIRIPDPNVTAYCDRKDHPTPPRIPIMSAHPDDVTSAYYLHDLVHHQPNGWLIGGPGGATGDVCNPCGGGNPDKTPMQQPRHDLCARGTRGRGRDCPCTHDRPHMRGIKPNTRPTQARPYQRPTEPEPALPRYITTYLPDPEDTDTDD